MHSNVWGMNCKPGRQESAISKASVRADHPPMCLKCRISAQQFNVVAMIFSIKRWGIIMSAIVMFRLP